MIMTQLSWGTISGANKKQKKTPPPQFPFSLRDFIFVVGLSPTNKFF